MAKRAQGAALKLRQGVELLARVIDQTQRRVLLGRTVPAEQKVLSLVEWHTDLIVKDRRDSQFGRDRTSNRDTFSIATPA